jgi:serine-type D-Ala-D-Ala carboxypeptidase/endopeptidase (penicillin-binding protein 4)
MRAVATLVLLCLAGGAKADPTALASALARDGATQGITVTLCFAPVCGQGPHIALDAHRLLPPGSVQKVVTSAAALDLLGPDHTFETRLRAGGRVEGRVLAGDLYLEGNGDPFLVSERLWLLAQDVAATGLREVQGKLIVDAGRVADLDSIRTAERTDSPYASPVSRVGVNFNNLCFLVRPGAGPGLPAFVASDPFPIAGVSIDSAVRTGKAEPLQWTRTADKTGETWKVQGAVASDSPAARVYRAASDPARLAGSVLEGLLAQSGIAVGGVEEGRAPSGAQVIASLPSLPLGALVRSMNGYSNNFMADLLLADLGGGSAGAGAERIGRWLTEVVGLTEPPVIRDGSGLSSANRISAEQIVAVLCWAADRERIYPDLYASFPRPRGTGTLEKRFRDAPPPSLRAKTGTLGDKGVSSIAGYVDTSTGERYAFCIIQQAAPGAGIKVADLRAREEAWLRLFTDP